MNYPTNTPLYKVVLDAMSRETAGTEFVVSGCDPSATGTGLNVAIAAGSTVSQQVGRAPAAATLTMTAAHATLDRRDIIYETGGAFAKADGIPASPALPPALPIGAVLIAVVKVAATQAVLAAGDVIDVRQTKGGSPAMPNLVLNSDFGRCTVFGLAMPETFADTSGYVKVDAGAAPTVASNILTFGAANNELAWCNQSFVWRNGRASATFKKVATNGVDILRWRIDANNRLEAYWDGTTLWLLKYVGGVQTNVQSAAVAATLNRWYWLEIERQGSTVIVRLYDTGGTVSGVTKASSTLLAMVVGTVADSAFNAGAHISITSNQANSQWGGISTGNGGVYVETWLPESWTVTHYGTLGGQAIGFDESADSGPLGKQWAMRAYIPAASRSIELGTAAQGPGTSRWSPSTAYTVSAYMKVSGKGGSGALLSYQEDEYDESGGYITTSLPALSDAGETAWTRKTGTATISAGARRRRERWTINPPATATGTAYFSLPQLEQGSAATVWRNAPADDGAIVWQVATASGGTDRTATSTAQVEIDSRDQAISIFLPWDAVVELIHRMTWSNSVANYNGAGFTVDGTQVGDAAYGTLLSSAPSNQPVCNVYRTTLAAGRHRIAATWSTQGGGTVTQRAVTPNPLIIIATRGK